MTTETPELGYTLWAVLRRDPARVAEGPVDDLAERVAAVQKTGVVIRGFYDTSGVKADSDLMVWLHGPDPQRLQWALRELRRSPLLTTLLPTWNALGVHRDAEFTASHLPAYLRGTEPKRWLTVYPFVRSYEWYLLSEDERRRMLGEHGMKGRDFPQVLANTVASFALGDYEWLLGLEADELVDLVDLMRHLRYVDARLHVREEIPFYTGRRIELAELPEVLA
ncbi:chlorite dismutase [Cryobacterium mesophilum]|uniref:Coproheme decarboxylase n=1 Tax=Terrimesophilobacter mesophilus TaxID=433647 RepID=A0A4R8VDL3_9MICO|nr:hydrogen peroxide-dependent heme synthase [Terrimesophilobacter mesophilus]MBB5633177.1 chlorite dismutase [Terrimesophilobacter mesophilus]TFB79927.1 chlorite dismutase [Terrimesophilobacter mesophilus]